MRTAWTGLLLGTVLVLLVGLGRQAEAQKERLPLPVDQIEHIVGQKGTVEHGVLDIELGRTDVGKAQGPKGVTLSADFELDGDIFFQPVGAGSSEAFLNGDLPLREGEVNPFMTALVHNGLVVQAFHQHLPSKPQIWFVHFRGRGDALHLARGMKKALAVTGIRLPQKKSPHPHSSLSKDRLEKILRGHASIGEHGVVTAWVLGKGVTIAGTEVNPQANVSTNIEFKPLGGSKAAVVADIAMPTAAVNPVIRFMLDRQWFQGCLYNQETGETPQLYFDHMVKVGDAYALAHEIRDALDVEERAER
jgi:hypothetical protein